MPGVQTLAASEVTSSSATLNAKVNPKGTQVSECVIEYGTTTSYGLSMPCSPSPGSGSTGVYVSAEVTSLTPDKTYHFRVVASNASGTTKGLDHTFKT